MPGYDQEQVHQPEPEQTPAPAQTPAEPGWADALLTPARAFAQQALSGNSWVSALLDAHDEGAAGKGTGLDFLGFATRALGADTPLAETGPTPAPAPGATPTPAPAPTPTPTPTTTPTPAAAPKTAEDADKQVDDALKKVSDRMSYGLFDWAVTDGDAREALGTLNSLPPDLQGKAVEKMDKTSFDRLLSNLPDMDRTQLQSLMDNTHDPEKKLKLWAEFQKGKTEEDLNADLKDEGHWYWRTDEQKQNKEYNDQRRKIASSSNDEIDGEVTAAMKLQADGKLTEKDVTDIMARKAKESEIERKYNINLTNEEGQGGFLFFSPQKDRRAWTMQELEQVQSGLERMPPDQVTNKSGFREIHREAVLKEHDGLGWKDNKGVGGNAGGGTINIFDTGAGYDPSTGKNTAANPWRTQKTSDLAGHNAGGTGKNAELSLIEEVITHEVGHTVHQADDKLWQKWRDISGWENLGKGDLKKRLMDSGKSEADADKEIKSLQDNRDKAYYDRNQTTAGGKSYEVNPYGSDFLGVKEGAIPGGSDWGYALSNPEDHFAEVYAKAVHQPEGLYKDLVSGPKDELKNKQTDLQAQKDRIAAMKTAGASADDIKKEEARQAELQTAVDKAQSASDIRQQQWDFFRKDVFHTDDSDIQALKAPPGKEAVYDEYKQKATMCQTPQQLADLRAKYKDKL